MSFSVCWVTVGYMNKPSRHKTLNQCWLTNINSTYYCVGWETQYRPVKTTGQMWLWDRPIVVMPYVHWMTILTVQQPRCIDPSHCGILLATRQAHPVMGRCTPLHTSTSTAGRDVVDTVLAKCCLQWVSQHSTSSWPCPNVGLSMVSKRPGADLPLILMVINLITCRPGEKTPLTHCSVCLSHGDAGLTGSFCIPVYRWFTLMGGLYIQQAQYVLPMSN